MKTRGKWKEGATRVELVTSRSAVECSATELYPRTDSVVAFVRYHSTICQHVGRFQKLLFYKMYLISQWPTGTQALTRIITCGKCSAVLITFTQELVYCCTMSALPFLLPVDVIKVLFEIFPCHRLWIDCHVMVSSTGRTDFIQSDPNSVPLMVIAATVAPPCGRVGLGKYAYSMWAYSDSCIIHLKHYNYYVVLTC